MGLASPSHHWALYSDRYTHTNKEAQRESPGENMWQNQRQNPLPAPQNPSFTPSMFKKQGEGLDEGNEFCLV